METLTQPGYKHTELGWIPDEWELRNLSQIGSFKKGKGIKKDQVSVDGVGCVRYGELYTHYNFIIKSTRSKISSDLIPETRKIDFGDLLFAGSGETKEEIGKCAAFLGSEVTYAGGDIIVLSPKSSDSIFLAYSLNQPEVAKQKAQFGQGDAVVHIYPNGLGKVKIALPPFPEQQAIATALSDMDAYIRSLEELIGKKEAIKQAAMQELLTPREGWEVRKLGELGKIKKGKGIKKDEVLESGFPCVRYGELYTNFDFVIGKTVSFINDESAINSVKITKGDILFAGSGETKEEIGKCATFLQEEGFAGGDIIILTPFKSDPLFLGYLLNTKEVVRQKTRMGQGDAVVHIYPSAISEIVVSLPKSINVQKEIGMLIRSFEEDILLLELNLKKCIQIKQAMMQDLLTGKVRLV